MPCDAARCRASARGDATEMPEHAKSFHDLPRAARSRILAFYGKSPRISSVFLSKFRSILPSLPDDETLESRSFRETSRVLAFTKFEMCIFLRTAAASRADVYIPTSMGKGMMLDHLRVLRLSCRHHGGRRQCGGRGERAEVVIHLNSVVPPLPSSPIFYSFSAQIGCAEVVNGRAQFTRMCAPGRMDSPSILTISQELHLGVDALLLGVGAIVPTWESVRRSWGHHLRRNTRVRLIVM